MKLKPLALRRKTSQSCISCQHDAKCILLIYLEREKKFVLTFWMASGVPKSLPPCRRKPHGWASVRLRRTVKVDISEEKKQKKTLQTYKIQEKNEAFKQQLQNVH